MKGIAGIARVAGCAALVAGSLFLGSCTGSNPIDQANSTVRVRFTASSPVTTGRFDAVGLILNSVDLVNIDPLANQIDPATYSLVGTSKRLDLTDGAPVTILETRLPVGRYRVTRVSIGSPSDAVMKDTDFTSPPPDAGVCLDHTGILSGSVSYLAEPPVPDLIIETTPGAPSDLNITIDATAFTNAFLANVFCSNCPVSEDPPPPKCSPTTFVDTTLANALLPSIVTVTN